MIAVCLCACLVLALSVALGVNGRRPWPKGASNEALDELHRRQGSR